MHNSVIAMAAGVICAVAACSAPPGTSPTERGSMEAPAGLSTEEGGRIRLSGEDIRTTGPDGERIPFGSERDFVEERLIALLGDDVERTANDECGAGKMEFTRLPGGLTVNFQRGNLVGWFLREGGAGDRIATAEGVTIGSTLADARQYYAVDPIDDSTLGSEFSTDEGFGMFTNASVTDQGGQSGQQQITQIYAGVNCFFR